MSPEVNDDVWAEVAFDTLAVRAGTARTNEGEHSEALFLTSSFVFSRLLQISLENAMLRHDLVAQKRAIFIHGLPILPFAPLNND